MTFSFTNSSFGGGSGTLLYDSVHSWHANLDAFVIEVFFSCDPVGGLSLEVRFGDPPVECILSTPTSFDCDPLMLIFSACPALTFYGFGTFTIADTAVAA